MASTGLTRRLEALERGDHSGFVPWVRIIQHEGQTEDEARAAHEAAHGSIGDARSILRVFIRKPMPHHA